MNKCCRTCKWFRNLKCNSDDVVVKREVIEEIISDIFTGMKVDANGVHLRSMVQGFEEVVLSRVEDVDFTPPDYDEFYCKYYE